ncbi:hypothetical protein JCM10212_000542 [Sporobolomyces blumeae]
MTFLNLYEAPAPLAEGEYHASTPLAEYDLNWNYGCRAIPDSLETRGGVRLVPLIPSLHAERLFDVYSRFPESFRWLPYGPFETYASFLTFIEASIRRDPQVLLFTVYDLSLEFDHDDDDDDDDERKEDFDAEGGQGLRKERIAGLVGVLKSVPQNRSIEIGHLHIPPPFQRTHVLSHSISLLLEWIMSPPRLRRDDSNSPSPPSLGLRRVQWFANSLNSPSIEAAKRLGFEVESDNLRWERVTRPGKQGVELPRFLDDDQDDDADEAKSTRKEQEERFGRGRHSTVLSIDWERWEEQGVKDLVLRTTCSRPVARSLDLLSPTARWATSSRRPFTSSASTPSRYRRFGDPPRRADDASDLGPSHAQGGQRVPDPWAVIRKLPTSSSSSSGSPFGDIKYRATTLLRQPLVLVLVGGGTAYYVLNLEQVAETGRWRFMDVSPSTEQEMARESYQDVMQQFGNRVLPDYHPTARYVQGVVKKIVGANGLDAGLGNDAWETFVVQDDKTQNAFVIPGGKIFVFSGILPIAKDEDGLAVILGHEIAHQVARHSAERLSSMKVLVALSYLLTTLGIDLGLSRVVLNVGMTLPNSRKHETEADLIGLRLANNACYNPLAAEGLWQRMDRVAGGGGGGLDFLSTHPSSKNRVVKVREWAEQVLSERPESCQAIGQRVGAFQELTGTRWR